MSVSGSSNYEVRLAADADDAYDALFHVVLDLRYKLLDHDPFGRVVHFRQRVSLWRPTISGNVVASIIEGDGTNDCALRLAMSGSRNLASIAINTEAASNLAAQVADRLRG
ncbi:hypothetical protein Q9S36_08355 [Microbacterium sp. ARD31]|uniref:hypothetical protein n=1 Tax=Microbacterium sp. ARD31 TaxID=2962576 RepID=UPI002880F17E|nr:hypothetical protein [Microbacterium sp. ARD31]MDT0180220.1 hypothetical protein [Microbacterium sp. ARD31]